MSRRALRDPRYITHLAQVFLCCLLLFPAGCKVSPKVNQPVAQVHPKRDVSATFEQARLRMRAMVHPMSSVIVESADQILAGTTDRAIRREALLWKIEAVPALRPEVGGRPCDHAVYCRTRVLPERSCAAGVGHIFLNHRSRGQRDGIGG